MEKRPYYILRLTYMPQIDYDRFKCRWGDPAKEIPVAQWEDNKPETRYGYEDKYVMQAMHYKIDLYEESLSKEAQRELQAAVPVYFLRFYKREEIEGCTARKSFCRCRSRLDDVSPIHLRTRIMEIKKDRDITSRLSLYSFWVKSRSISAPRRTCF